MDDKRINTLAEFVNIFADLDTEQFMNKLVLYVADIESDTSKEYPFPVTDVNWARSLMDGYLQAQETCDGDISPLKMLQYEMNNYLVSCKKENPEMYFLVEKFYDNDACADGNGSC